MFKSFYHPFEFTREVFWSLHDDGSKLVFVLLAFSSLRILGEEGNEIETTSIALLNSHHFQERKKTCTQKITAPFKGGSITLSKRQKKYT